MTNALSVFNGKEIRKVWHNEEWWFSVVDVVGILSESQDARNYWKVLKHRLIEEGSETVTKCNQLKLPAEDGKLRETDCGYTEIIFRIIQAIPSPKAEPFKLWLAKVTNETVQTLQKYQNPKPPRRSRARCQKSTSKHLRDEVERGARRALLSTSATT